MKRRIIGVLVLLIVVGGGYWWWKHRGVATSDGLTLYGNVELREVDLAFRQSGRLEQLLVEEGAKVQAGQLLAKLDDEPYRLAVSVRESQVEVAQAALDKLLAGSRSQDISQVEASLRQARLVSEQRKRDWDRIRNLGRDVSKKEHDDALTGYQMATAAQQQVEAKLSLLKAGARDEDIAMARSQLDAAKVALAQAKQVLGDTELRAQQSGVVSQRLHEPGSIVSPQQPIYIIAIDDKLYVRSYIDESRLGEAFPGREAEILTDSRETPYHGTIGFVSPQAEFTPKVVQTPELRSQLVYRLRFVVSDADDGLRQGMPVTLRLLGASKAVAGGG